MGQTTRQLGTTIGAWILHLFTCVLFPKRGTLHHGCTSTASLTGTRRVSTVGALQCWLFFTGSFARRVIRLHPQPHLVDASTYYSCGCGLVYQLAVSRFCLIVTSSQVFLHVDVPHCVRLGPGESFACQGMPSVRRVHE